MFPRHRYYRVDSRRFYVHDVGLWRHGRWYHGVYDGVYGWWWMVGATWYFYERPLYPYPSETLAPVYYVDVPAAPAPAPAPVPVTVPAYVPPAQPAAPVAVQPAPQQQLTAAAPPAPAQYYYCSSPAGYYPYVRACPGGWATVPATPPQ